MNAITRVRDLLIVVVGVTCFVYGLGCILVVLGVIRFSGG